MWVNLLEVAYAGVSISPANHLNIGRWFITLFGLSSVCKCISGGWRAVGLRVAAAVVLSLVVRGGHTLVVCIMRFPGSSLWCVRDPFWSKPPGDVEEDGWGWRASGRGRRAKGKVAGEWAALGIVLRCPPHRHLHQLLAVHQPICCQLQLPLPPSLACTKCLLWLLAQWKCISPHDNISPSPANYGSDLCV